MSRLARAAVLVGLASTAVAPVEGGVYDRILASCDTMDTECVFTIPVSERPPNDPSCKGDFPGDRVPCEVTPFAITHPLGYTGVETAIALDVCIDASAADFIPAALRAIGTWNELEPNTGNCIGCRLWEEGAPPPGGSLHAETTLLHELGHCAIGVGHIERLWDVTGDGLLDRTSYAVSGNTVRILDGDGLRGNLEDAHEEMQMGSEADNLTWFRIQDNDPAIVDTTVIDIDSYTRSVQANLPAGHTWAAAGNRAVNESLPISAPGTQSVMYGLAVRQMEYVDLSADDVNMAKMARTGVNLQSGDTDDYTLQLNYVGSCANPHDLKISAIDLGPGSAGACLADIDYSFPVFNGFLARHFSLVPFASNEPEIFVNTQPDWDFGSPDLELTGFCPGDVFLEAREFVPTGDVAVLRSNSLGSSPIPAGACVNTLTDLDSPTLVNIVSADSRGRVSLAAALPEPLCDAFVQLIDLSTCGLSNVDVVPSAAQELLSAELAVQRSK